MKLKQGDKVVAAEKIVPEDKAMAGGDDINKVDIEINRNRDEKREATQYNKDLHNKTENASKEQEKNEIEFRKAEIKNNSSPPPYNPKPNPANVPTIDELRIRQQMRKKK